MRVVCWVECVVFGFRYLIRRAGEAIFNGCCVLSTSASAGARHGNGIRYLHTKWLIYCRVGAALRECIILLLRLCFVIGIIIMRYNMLFISSRPHTLHELKPNPAGRNLDRFCKVSRDMCWQGWPPTN